MAENLGKSLKEKPPKIRKKNGFEEIPDAKIKERPPKILKGKEKTKTRSRVGGLQMGINPYGKPKIMNNGCEFK